MTTSLSGENVGAPAAASVTQPYAPGWIDALNARLARLPVPAWLPLIAAWMVLFALRTLLPWQGYAYLGAVPLLSLAVLTGLGFWTLILSQMLAASGHEMLRRMRPMLRMSDAEYARFEFEALTAPVAPSLAAGLCGLLLIPLTAPISSMLGTTPLGSLVFDGLVFAFQWAVYGGMIYHVFRTIRLVNRFQDLPGGGTNHVRSTPASLGSTAAKFVGE